MYLVWKWKKRQRLKWWSQFWTCKRKLWYNNMCGAEKKKAHSANIVIYCHKSLSSYFCHSIRYFECFFFLLATLFSLYVTVLISYAQFKLYHVLMRSTDLLRALFFFFFNNFSFFSFRLFWMNRNGFEAADCRNLIRLP